MRDVRRHHHHRDPRSRTQRFLPGWHTLRHYERSWLRGDLLAGITVAAYLIPQVLAYAAVAGLPPVTGLWAIVGPLLIYAFVGSSRELSVGPESTTALMTATAVAGITATVGVDRYADVATALAILVGIICLLGGLARLGFLADLLSKPVLAGYMAGIAILMIVSQLGKVTGRSVHGAGTIAQLGDVITHLSEIHLPTLALAVVVIAALFGIHRRMAHAPGPLIVMIASAALVALGHLDELGIRTIGAIPQGLPVPHLPDVRGLDLQALLPAALGIAVVGYSDNVLTGRAFAASRGESIDPNQEFVALGAANLAAGLSQGFPVSSSGSRAVIGMSMGSRTQLYSLVCVVMVVATIFVLGPALATFPSAALGGVVVYAAVRLVDVSELRRIRRFRTSEVLLAAATCLGVLLTDVLGGIGFAVTLSVLDLLRRIADPHDGVLGYAPGVAGMHDIEDYPGSVQVPGLVVYRYDAPLCFANADNFRRRAIAALAEGNGPPSWFLLNAEAVVEIDLTSLDALEELRATLAERDIVFAMARVKHELEVELSGTGFLEKVGRDRLFATLPTAVSAYAAWYAARTGAPPAGLPPGLPPATMRLPRSEPGTTLSP